MACHIVLCLPWHSETSSLHGIIMASWNGNIFHVTGLCAGNSPVNGEFPSQRPVMRSFENVFDLCLNKRSSKLSRRRWFETQSRSLWRHCNVCGQNGNLHVCMDIKVRLTGIQCIIKIIHIRQLTRYHLMFLVMARYWPILPISARVTSQEPVQSLYFLSACEATPKYGLRIHGNQRRSILKINEHDA